MFPPGVLLCFTVKDGSGLGNLAKPICLQLKIGNLLKESSLSLWVGLGGSRGNCSEKGLVGQKLREGMLRGGRVGNAESALQIELKVGHCL